MPVNETTIRRGPRDVRLSGAERVPVSDFFNPNTKIGRLRRASLDKLHEHERDGAIPTNGRFVWYELEQDGVVPKHYLHADGSKPAGRLAPSAVTAAVTAAQGAEDGSDAAGKIGGR
jgi:hypothetical protein